MKYTLLSIFLLSFGAHPLLSSNLLEHSPFLPANFLASKSAVKPAKDTAKKAIHYQLRGISVIGNSYNFSIFDSRTNTSVWIEPGTTINGFKILSYDPVAHELTYSWNNQIQSIRLNNGSLAEISYVPTPPIQKGNKSLYQITGSHAAGFEKSPIIQSSPNRNSLIIFKDTQNTTGAQPLPDPLSTHAGTKTNFGISQAESSTTDLASATEPKNDPAYARIFRKRLNLVNNPGGILPE